MPAGPPLGYGMTVLWVLAAIILSLLGAYIFVAVSAWIVVNIWQGLWALLGKG